jgi:hypothetical protein
MADTAGQAPSSAATAFARRIRAFHASLPPEEQRLLERVFALAEAAVASGADGEVAGYFATVSGTDPGVPFRFDPDKLFPA